VTWSGVSGKPSTADARLLNDALLDLALPRTDAGVAVQWAVMVPVWIVALVWAPRLSAEARRLVIGLVSVNLAWFVVRMLH